MSLGKNHPTGQGISRMVRWTSFPVVVTWMMIVAETTTAGTTAFFFLDARTMMGNGWVHDFREFVHPILVRYIVDCFGALAVVGRSRCISHFCEGRPNTCESPPLEISTTSTNSEREAKVTIFHLGVEEKTYVS